LVKEKLIFLQKGGTMLKLKFLFKNYELAKECVKLYDYDKESIDEMLMYFHISSNAVYPFRYGTNPERICLLRLSPAEEKPFSDVASEISLIKWLLDRGFPVMRPIPMKNGNFTDQVNSLMAIKMLFHSRMNSCLNFH
jgi:Ser/Thr protein kinase RdoA (MazF antagonist)